MAVCLQLHQSAKYNNAQLKMISDGSDSLIDKLEQ